LGAARRERAPKLGSVVPGVLRAGDLLAPLVPLPGEEDDVARLGETDRLADRASPVEHDAHPSQLAGADTAEHRIDDRAGILGARVVGGEDRRVGGRERRAHRRPLAGVAVASAAADDDQLAARAHAPCGRQHAAEALGSVRVVDEREHRPGRDSFHAATRAGQSRDDPQDALNVLTEQGRSGDDRGEVARVVLAEEPRTHAPAGDADDAAALVAALERPRQQRVCSAPVEGGPCSRGGDHEPSVPVVGVRERESRGWEAAEEALLDRRVGLDRAVVVEMVAIEAREDAAVEVDAGDPLLVDPVGRDLHEAVAAAGGHHRRQEPLQLDGIRSRVRVRAT
jgi:hypothetical protein